MEYFLYIRRHFVKILKPAQLNSMTRILSSETLCPRVSRFTFRWTRVTRALGTRLFHHLKPVERIDWAMNFLMRCRFTRHKRHVISMKSITLTTSTRMTRTSRIFNFSTCTSEEYWTCLLQQLWEYSVVPLA